MMLPARFVTLILEVGLNYHVFQIIFYIQKKYFLEFFASFIVTLLSCLGFLVNHSRSLDNKIVFLINVLSQKMLKIRFYEEEVKH